jgi:hypothetical protein
MAVAPHEGALIRRRVEVLGHRGIRLALFHECVLLAHRVASERHQLFEQVAQGRVARGRHLEGQMREIIIRTTDVELHDLERGAAADDDVEHRVEEI